jgi:hypothetical protein
MQTHGMTRGSWILLAAVGVVMFAIGGALAGAGHGIVGTVLVVIGAATMGIAIGRYRSSRSPFK